MKKISNIISYLLHPILMPTVGILFILYSGIYLSFIPYQTKKIILLISAFTTILFPLSILLILYIQKKISKLTIPNRKERLIPLFISIIFYYITYYVFKKYNIPIFIQHFMLTSFICLLATFIIHLKWKISIHMVAIGGILGLWSALNFIYYMPNNSLFLSIAIILSGIVGSARLILKAHNQSQIYAGFFVGYVLSFIILIILSF